MEFCKNCKKQLGINEIYWFELGSQYKIAYCASCYNARKEKEKQIWENMLSGGHL